MRKLLAALHVPAILFALSILAAGCGKGVKPQASRIATDSLYTLLRASNNTVQADGTVIVEYIVEASGAPSFRFTPSSWTAAPLTFSEDVGYSKTYPASQTEIIESGLLEALDASGKVVSSVVLQTSPLYPGGSDINPPAPSNLCTTANFEPAVVEIPVSSTGLVLGDAVARLKITTAQAAALVDITEKKLAKPVAFRVLLTGDKNHEAEIRFATAGASELALTFNLPNSQRSACRTTTFIVPVANPPSCNLSLGTNRVLVPRNGKAVVPALLTAGGPVTEAYIGNIRVALTGLPVNFEFFVGRYVVEARVVGPTGSATCAAPLEVIDATPVCELRSSVSDAYFGEKIYLSLIYMNANLGVPVLKANIDGRPVSINNFYGQNIYTDTIFNGEIETIFGKARCSVRVR